MESELRRAPPAAAWAKGTPGQGQGQKSQPQRAGRKKEGSDGARGVEGESHTEETALRGVARTRARSINSHPRAGGLHSKRALLGGDRPKQPISDAPPQLLRTEPWAARGGERLGGRAPRGRGPGGARRSLGEREWQLLCVVSGGGGGTSAESELGLIRDRSRLEAPDRRLLRQRVGSADPGPAGLDIPPGA